MRHKPKRWSPPRSARGREQLASGGRQPTSYAIIRTLYPDPTEDMRPWWAELAYSRGWMTFSEYAAVEPTEPSPLRRLYDEFTALTAKAIVRHARGC